MLLQQEFFLFELRIVSFFCNLTKMKRYRVSRAIAKPVTLRVAEYFENCLL